MLGVCDRITDNILQEDLENTMGSMPRRARLQIACEASISGTEEQQRGRTYRFSDDTLNVVTKESYGVKGMEVRVVCESELDILTPAFEHPHVFNTSAFPSHMRF
jgi:hypothetical protein